MLLGDFVKKIIITNFKKSQRIFVKDDDELLKPLNSNKCNG